MLTPSSAECPLFTERRAHVSFFYSGDGRLSPCLSVMQGYHAKPCKASLELINVLVASSMLIVVCSSVLPLHHNNCIYLSLLWLGFFLFLRSRRLWERLLFSTLCRRTLGKLLSTTNLSSAPEPSRAI
jgi:hypothetical protein